MTDKRAELWARADATVVEEALEAACPGPHKHCWHHLDAETAMEALYGLGWRPNKAELEAENARLRETVDRLALDRETLRRQIKGTDDG